MLQIEAKYCGIEVSGPRRLKLLEEENRELKQLLAGPILDIAMLKELNSKNGYARRGAVSSGQSLPAIGGEPVPARQVIEADWTSVHYRSVRPDDSGLRPAA